MRHQWIGIGLLGVSLALALGCHNVTTPPAEETAMDAPALQFVMKDIDGQDVNLTKYQGDVVLIVNVASKCGNTPQYKGLEELYEKYKDRGLVILGFPANNFGHQEPGAAAEIKSFCTTNYGVTFPMFAKISVQGADSAPLYQYLTHLPTQPQPAGDITWNFEKFLIGRDGQVVARYTPKTQPADPQVVAAIERELARSK